jgi:hypothetical protein
MSKGVSMGVKTCELCSSQVTVYSIDEGTNSYEPIMSQADLRRVESAIKMLNHMVTAYQLHTDLSKAITTDALEILNKGQ